PFQHPTSAFCALFAHTMAQPVTYTGSETAQPIMTYQPMDAGQPMTAAAAEATYYVDQNGQPVTFVDEMGQPVQYVTQGAPIGYDIPQPMTYIQGADGLQPATSMVLGSPTPTVRMLQHWTIRRASGSPLGRSSLQDSSQWRTLRGTCSR
ncbi:unnamed protein product, partial [Symbiodinium sp. KB8]